MNAPSIEAFEHVALERGAEPVRFGLIALSTDLTSERDAWRLIPPERAVLHVARVPFANPTTPENLRAMAPSLSAAAALLVPEQPLAAICYGCTAASVVIGDDQVEAAIQRGRPGVAVVTPARAAVRALASLGARRIALLTPYLPETTRPFAGYLAASGLKVVRTMCLGLADDRDIARVSEPSIIDAALAADHPGAEALFISCTALPALNIVAEIEARLGKPVVTSNQASLWEMLALADLPPARACGRLFAAPRSAADVA